MFSSQLFAPTVSEPVLPAVAVCAQGREVLAGGCEVGGIEPAVSLGTDQVLLGQTEEFGHTVHVEFGGSDHLLVAEVFDQHGPGQAVGISRGDLLEVGAVTHVIVRGVGVEHPLCGDEVGIVILIVAVEVQEDLTERSAIGGGGVSDLPDDLGAPVISPHM